jgi:serine/threonine-protein kinase
VAESGKIEPLPFPTRSYLTARVSPNARQIAAGVLDAGSQIVRILDLERGTDDALDLPGNNWFPTWHPDGRRLATRTMRKGDFDIYLKDITSNASPVALLDSSYDDSPYAWATERKLVIEQSDDDGRYRLKMLDLDQPGAPIVLGEHNPNGVSISPDGRWLAESDDHTSRDEVYVRPLFADGVLERITTDGGSTPVWSRSGREIYYLRGSDVLAAAWREEAGRFRVERERVWARLPALPPRGIFDIAPDGRLLLALPKSPPPPPQVRVVLKLGQELAQKFSRQ